VATEYTGMIPLQRAVLCADCEMVSAAINVCPGCGASTLLSLAKVLDRTDDKPRQVVTIYCQCGVGFSTPNELIAHWRWCDFADERA